MSTQGAAFLSSPVFSFFFAKLYFILGENGLLTSTCNFLHPLFGIEKAPCEDKRQKIFAAQTPPRKRGYAEDFAHLNKQRLQKLKNPHFAPSTKLCRKIAARQARGYGVLYEVKLFSEKVLFLIYSNSQQDSFFCPARYREMTFTNISFMFGWCGVKIRFCFVGTK